MKQITHTTWMALLLAFVLLGGSSLFATAADTKPPQTGKALGSAFERAKKITLPQFKVDGVTLDEAARELHAAGRRNAAVHAVVSFVVSAGAKAQASPKITLDLKNVTLAEAAERLAQSAGLQLVDVNYALAFMPKTSKP